MNLMHATICPLLWLWYEDDTACSLFRFLQNSFKFSKAKLPPASDLTPLGNSYSGEMTIPASIKLSANKISLSLWWLGTCCDNLQCKDNAYCTEKSCHFQLLPIVCQVSHGEWFFLWTVSAKIKICRTIFILFPLSAFMFI